MQFCQVLSGDKSLAHFKPSIKMFSFSQIICIVFFSRKDMLRLSYGILYRYYYLIDHIEKTILINTGDINLSLKYM